MSLAGKLGLKHGPDGEGGRGPCEPNCWKCQQEAAHGEGARAVIAMKLSETMQRIDLIKESSVKGDESTHAAPGEVITKHSGSKYVRTIVPPSGCAPGQTDVYAVLEAFDVRCPAVQHALKKLLCAGLRSKGTKLGDLREARDAISRAIEMQEAREQA